MKPFFEIASRELIEQLFKRGHRKQFWASDVIFAEGEKAEFLPIVLNGQVKMVRYPEIGKEFISVFSGMGRFLRFRRL